MTTVSHNGHRIASILNAPVLGKVITGLRSFELTRLELGKRPLFTLPDNLRLGHIAERSVVELITASVNYSILYENLQILDNGKTIGELDAIIRNENTGKLTHIEIAYKFYLLDPSISDNPIKNWIGPNRNDTLFQKLEKLKTQQFPLLYHPKVTDLIGKRLVESCSQSLCFMAQLYIPWKSKIKVPNSFFHAIAGYYISLDALQNEVHTNRFYHIPQKTEWGIDPASCDQWLTYSEIQSSLASSIKSNRSVLVWEKKGDNYSTFFVVWW